MISRIACKSDNELIRRRLIMPDKGDSGLFAEGVGPWISVVGSLGSVIRIGCIAGLLWVLG